MTTTITMHPHASSGSSDHLPTTTAMVLHGPRDLRPESRPVWPPQPGHVRLRPLYTTLCGSDLHYYLSFANGPFAVRTPLVLGHEAAGVVTAVGAGVTNLKEGMRVAVEPGIMCGVCGWCKEGRYNLCKDMRFCSSAKTWPHTDGTLRGEMEHPAHLCFPIPDNLPTKTASLAEPLSVLLHAISRCPLLPSNSSSASTPFTAAAQAIAANAAALSSNTSANSISNSISNPAAPRRKQILIVGVGAIGCLASSLLRHLLSDSDTDPAPGSPPFDERYRICATDINPARLKWGCENGFFEEGNTFCLPRPDPPTSTSTSTSTPATTPTPTSLETGTHLSKLLLSHFFPPSPQEKGFDLVLEATGAPSSIVLSLLSSLPGSQCVLVGMGARDVELPIGLVAAREVEVRGSFRYAGCFGGALGLLAGGGKEGTSFGRQVEKLVTQTYPLSRTKEAFESMARGRDEGGGLVMKVCVGGEE